MSIQTAFCAAPATRLRRRRAMVTGGAGFLGSHLCERLVDSGVAVDCVDDLSSGSADNVRRLTCRPGFRLLEHDVSEPRFAGAFPGPYDMVLHCAGPASRADCRRRPLKALDACGLGTRNALAVADRDGARFLLVSSGQVYGDPMVHPQREDYWGNVDPVGPRGAYDESKRFSEALTTAHATAAGTDAGIVRVFNTYGPRMRADDRRAIPTFIRQALAGEPVTVEGDGRQTRSLCYVDDTVDGVLRVAVSRSVRPVNIGGDDETTIEEIARRVIGLTGSRSRLTFVDRSPHDPARRRPDTTLARELFGWTPKVTWEEGFKRTIASFLERPPDGRPLGERHEWPGREPQGGRPSWPEGGVRHACSW
ncbi:NAD-dependent epimerase/dehydratase family protein [Streptomyces sp. TP-A0356]|uniref:NAD-dependent epimerase/dehydratase family protein n=1 Tax=Streptomyces sp. TP-A0356 TaxID=1359208 RepID=UPI00099E6940|nr:NAD-dependent epimerase/dehydratase family protein [Streptomyces sp. TP-A0356]